MKYILERQRATFYGEEPNTDRPWRQLTPEELQWHQELAAMLRHDPRYQTYNSEVPLPPQIRTWDYPAVVFDDGRFAIGEAEIRRQLTPDRISHAQLPIEQSYTNVDSFMDHPTMPGWTRELCLRTSQYNEQHAIVADFQSDFAREGPVYTSYQGYNAKIEAPQTEHKRSNSTITMQVDMCGKDTSFWDGTVELTLMPSWLKIYDLFRVRGDSIDTTGYEERLRHAGLVMATMACYWEIDRALHKRNMNGITDV